MNITIDENECIGCGICCLKFPDFFAVNHDGIAMVLVGYIPIELHKPMYALQERCPVQAVEIDMIGGKRA